MGKKIFITIFFLFLIIPYASKADVTLSIDNTAGYIGSYYNPVDIILDNQADTVKSVQVRITDVDDYLSPNTLISCVTTTRTNDYSCSVLNVGPRALVLLTPDTGTLIATGTGPVCRIKYDVAETAPPGECRDLQLDLSSVVDEFDNSTGVTLVDGQFCFSSCNTDPDCDDGLYCSGTDTCNSTTLVCNHTGSPCSETECGGCDETEDSCIFADNGTSCTDDGVFCNGDEICDGSGSCISPGDPCLPLDCKENLNECRCTEHDQCAGPDFCIGDYCNFATGNCTIEADRCGGLLDPYHPYCDPEGEFCYCMDNGDCDDGLFCTGAETCTGGSCITPGNPCPPSLGNCVEDEGGGPVGTCHPDDFSITVGNGSGVPGDGLQWSLDYQLGSSEFTEGATLLGFPSQASGRIVSHSPGTGDWGSGTAEGTVVLTGVYDSGIFVDNETITDNMGGSARVSGVISGGDLTYPGTTVYVGISNTKPVHGIEISICDEGDRIEVVRDCIFAEGCSPETFGCDAIGRATSWSCNVNEEDGCVNVTLLPPSPATNISTGVGDIFRLYFDVKNNALVGSIGLEPQNITVLDDGTNEIYGTSLPGTFTINCNDDAHCDDGLFCNGADETCVDQQCVPGTPPCDPSYCCNEDNDTCYDLSNDSDCDGVDNATDNCPDHPNGPDFGTCVYKLGLVRVISTGVVCTDNNTCETGEYCQMVQGDFNEDEIGDVCECYADFNNNRRLDGGDMFIMVSEANASLRNCDPDASYHNPPALGCCHADANENGRIDGGDMFIIVSEANASKRNCPVIPHCPNLP